MQETSNPSWVQHSNRPALADLERALLLGRGRRSLPPGSMRKTSGAMGDLFCGDTVMQCGVWLNRLFPLRWVRQRYLWDLWYQLGVFAQLIWHGQHGSSRVSLCRHHGRWQPIARAERAMTLGKYPESFNIWFLILAIAMAWPSPAWI